MDRSKLEAGVALILEGIGDAGTDSDRTRTPARAADMFMEMFAGVSINPRAFLEDPLQTEHHEPIVLHGIAVRSMCQHHLVPMVGVAHLAYVPNGRIVGFDRLIKVVDSFARRPQIQERLTQEIADTIDEMLQPLGVAVLLELEQMCMTIRGTKQINSRVVTTGNRGVYHHDPAMRAEFHRLIRREGIDRP